MRTKTTSRATESDADADSRGVDAETAADPSNTLSDDHSRDSDSTKTAATGSDDEVDDTDSADTGADSDLADDAPTTHQTIGWRIGSPRRAALVVALAAAIVLSGLVGWLGYRMQQSQHADQHRAAFIQAARQGAVNLTTIDWEHADRDVRRILDSATGNFYDDFAKRSAPFIDVVKQVKSKSEGTVTLAGLESITGDQAQVLVAMNVKTTTAADTDPSPRSWRMRIDVQKVGDDVKVSNVEFVP